MADHFDQELVKRICERLKEDWRRTGDGDASRAPKELKSHYVAPTLADQQFWNSLREQAMVSRACAKPEPLKPVQPLSAAQLAKAESTLGFKLPTQLRQLYLNIGDGGFGPFTGIRKLANWMKDYVKLRAEPFGAKKHEWPEALLPIVFWNGPRFCIDRKSGKIIFWTKPLLRANQAVWDASFLCAADSLAEWLEAWVDCPTNFEGGPRGGWQAPPHIQQLIEDRFADNNAPRERRVLQRTLPGLPEELLSRLRERAALSFEHGRETRAGDRYEQVDPQQLLSALGSSLAQAGELKGVAENIESNSLMQSALGRLKTLGGQLLPGGARPGKAWLGPSASQWDISDAGTKLGFPLPTPLKQLYEIADGGFGLGASGLYPLRIMISRYREFTGLKGPSGELWPARLLPIFEAQDVLNFLDVESGEVVVQAGKKNGYDSFGQSSFQVEVRHASLADLLHEEVSKPLKDKSGRRLDNRAA